MKYFALMILLSGAPQLQAAIPVEQALELCRTEQNALRRLNCYDSVKTGLTENSATAVATPHPKSTPQPVINQQLAVEPNMSAPEQTAESRFGLEQKLANENTADNIFVTVKALSENSHKKLVVEFTNGQIWRQTDSEDYQIKVGQTHFIKRGALGAFYLGNDNTNRTMRVKREK